MVVLQKLLLFGGAMCRRNLRVLRSVSFATALSQQVMASYPECIARPAAKGFMEPACISGFSLAANLTVLIASRLGDLAPRSQCQSAAFHVICNVV